MEHPRKVIRRAIADALKVQSGEPAAFPTDAGARVYDSRDFPADARVMPVVLVYFESETIDPDYRHQGGVRRRIMDIRVECYHVGDDGAEKADLLAWQVENLLRDDPTLGNRVEWCQLTGTEMSFVANAEVAFFVAIMTYQVIYYTHVIEPDGMPPLTVMLGFDPETGPGNEPDYTEVIGV